jgi:SPP1 gp7 family putative phage head morphogenesis protein
MTTWDRVEAARQPFYRRVNRRISREFAIECDAGLGVLSRQVTPADAVGEVLRVIERREANWHAFIDQIFVEVGLDFASRWRSMLSRKADGDEQIDQWRDSVRDYLRSGVGTTKVTRISATTRAAIRHALTEGVAAGESIPQLAKRLRTVYEDFTRERAVMIARTEVIAASNLGSQAAARISGVVSEKFWIATADNRTREWHADADGQSRPLNEPYSVHGESLMFPGDSSLGASASNLVRCRCAEGYRAL